MIKKQTQYFVKNNNVSFSEFERRSAITFSFRAGRHLTKVKNLLPKKVTVYIIASFVIVPERKIEECFYDSNGNIPNRV